jgi:hypothetical protein
MVTKEEVRDLYAGWNGEEAAKELSEPVLEATAHYANMNELVLGDDGVYAISTALDVLRLVEGGEFPYLKAAT